MSDTVAVSATVVKTGLQAIQRSQRILYPGVAIALFLNHRYGLGVFDGLGSQQVPSLFLSLLLGTLVYFSYRAIVHPIIQSFQGQTVVGIPQQVFHKRLCKELGLTGVICDSLRFSQACLGYFQTAYKDEIKSPDPSHFNSGSHLLYMTGTIGSCLFLHDAFLFNLKKTTYWVSPTPYDLVAWAILGLGGFAAAISYDRHADYREAIVLYQHEDKYKAVLEKVKTAWPEGMKVTTRKDRFDYIKLLVRALWLPLVILAILVAIAIVMLNRGG